MPLIVWCLLACAAFKSPSTEEPGLQEEYHKRVNGGGDQKNQADVERSFLVLNSLHHCQYGEH